MVDLCILCETTQHCVIFPLEMTILRGDMSNVKKYPSVMCLHVLCGVIPTIIIIIRNPISFMEVIVNKVYVKHPLPHPKGQQLWIHNYFNFSYQ